MAPTLTKTRGKKKSALTKQDILIKKARKILAPRGRRAANLKDPRAIALQAEMMRLGFIMDDALVAHVSKLSDKQIMALYQETVTILSNMVGSDVKWEPMYPNFPEQVLSASDVELFVNAICHYWSFGQWKPTYVKNDRMPAFEAVKFKTLSLGDDDDVKAVFTDILGSNASVSEQDKAVITYLMSVYSEQELAMALPDQIPFKEQLCAFVAECLDSGKNTLGVASLKTATDILRVATHLSGGDISLAENSRFKSFPRALRRDFVGQLEKVVNADDIARHKNKWVRLAHSLHIGEYAAIAPKATKALANARSSSYKFRTFDAKAEAAIAQKDTAAIIKVLSQRPGNFARRLDHVMRMFSKQKAKTIATAFIEVADKVDTRVLLQLYGHFKTRTSDVDKRLVFPKGQVSKGILLRNNLPAQGKLATRVVMNGIEKILRDRFSNLDDMGKVFIDPALKDCPIPLSLRSASDGLEVVGRGTKIPLTDKKTLRLFIYWVGRDIDLSAAAYNEDFSRSWQVSYTNLREAGIKSCHSGDITNAPNGAAEFIDVDMRSALKAGARYVVMQVYVYSGPTFAEHEKCYAGWMTRDEPNSNEVYNAKTVEQKIDVTAESRTAIPVVFDLKERKAIWLDMVTSDRGMNGLNRIINSVETNRANLLDVVEGAMSLDNKPTLYDLFTMHAEARGEIVDDIEDAETVFSWDGDVKPTDANTILSEYLN